MKRFLTHLTLLTLAFLSAASAQQPNAQAPAAAAPAAPAPPPDPKLLKQLESITHQKFSREPSDVFHALEQAGTADPATLNEPERFRAYFRAGDWKKIREELTQMPPDLARKIFDKMLADLTEKQRPGMRLDDVLGLADAVPGELTSDNLRKLGQLLGLAVPVGESYWLADRIRKGTDQLGGTDPEKRLRAGRVLLAGGFKDLARTCLPPLDQVEKIADESVRNELLAFLVTQRESEEAQRGQIQRVWDENLRTVTLGKANQWEVEKAGSALAKLITQVSPTTLAPVFGDLVRNHPDAAVRLIGALGRKLQNEVRSDATVRADNLEAQATLANLLAENVDAGTQPWSQLLQMMAEFWVVEAETTFAQKSGKISDKQKFVTPEEMLATAPAGKWANALPASLRERIDVSMSRVILACANFDQAADRIIEIGKRLPEAGVALAEDFLTVWARTHNPQLPEALRKKYELADDARIPVTPIMMEKNIDSLARMMGLFREAGIAPKDCEKVVGAFDLAYSSAEAYRTSHIEKVFGPLAKMDEPLFFLIISRMNGNLSERWRKMEVQKAGLTRRDETQTLEMVRAGYATGLGMIDQWLGGHPESSSRALTLAGTLLADWGDFEYFQELVTGDARKRMLGYKEKNLQAQDYFQRGAEAYAKEVPRLTPADYSIEAYLAWFNGLLGIGSNGQINLSKAINRAALTRIREHLLALPGKAAQTHMSQFARLLNARLSDEKEPLHEDLKYRYLASALIVTKDDPFTLGAEKKVAYFDELLSEIRLQTCVDGPNTVGRDQDFGIVVSVIHTEAMGRVAQFGQYLTNDPGAAVAAGKQQPWKKQKTPLARKMREAQGPRDELELSLTEALAPFFDIKSITFASPEVKPRPTPKTGWEETVLAYLLVRAKDASVDKIPPVQMELKFVDLTGPVTIPAESAETVIKVGTGEASPRPAKQIEITQTLDTRQFQINGALPLEIKATGSGLIPELDQLLDLDALKKRTGIKAVNPHEGLQVKEINTWGDAIAPVSERLWTVALDGAPIREAEGLTEFRFPVPLAKDATAVYQTYDDMNLATLPQPAVKIGRTASGPGAVTASQSHAELWVGLGFVAALVGLGLYVKFGQRGTPGAGGTGMAHDVFKMPHVIDGFSVIALLRRLRASPLLELPDSQRQELQQDIERVQQGCFGANEAALSETDLRSVAEKWLRTAC